MSFFRNKKIMVFALAVVFFVTQFTGAIMVASADDGVSNPPSKYAPNCVKKLDAYEISLNASFYGSETARTIKRFGSINFSKYDSFEFDIFIGSDNFDDDKIRVNIFDSTFENLSVAGRAYYDITINTNEWVHISISSWLNGHGRDGDPRDAQGYFIESLLNKSNSIYTRNICLTSEGLVSPDGYPEDVITKAIGSINSTVSSNIVEDNVTLKINPIDLSYGDNIELDYYIGSPADQAKVRLVFFDNKEKRATYSLENADTNVWNHLKFSNKDLNCAEGFNIKQVEVFKLEDTEVGCRYYFDNICTTGLAWPKEFPEGVQVKNELKYDFIGSANGLKSLSPYGAICDFTQYDFFEFDLYIESANPTANVYYFLYDATYDIESNKLPAANQRRQDNYQAIKTNEWVHFRVCTSTLGSKAGTGDLSKIAGFYLTALAKDNRYIIVNQCLTNLVIPERQINFKTISEIDGFVDYKGTDSSTDKISFDTSIDFTAGKFLEFDINAVAKNSELEIDIVIEDSNGKTSSQRIKINSDLWIHKILKKEAFTGEADLTDIKYYYISGLTDIYRIALYNVSISDIEIPEMQNKYEFVQKFDNMRWDFKPTTYGSAPIYFNDDKSPIDLTQMKNIEFDVCYEPLSDVRATKLRLYYKDTRNKMGFIDFENSKFEKVDGWYHFNSALSALNNATFGGDPTEATCFYLDALDSKLIGNMIIHAENFCFTELLVPERSTRFPIEFETDLSWDVTNIKGPETFKTVKRFEGNEQSAVFDLTTATHIEFDVYVESRFETNKLRSYVVDDTFKNTNTGRGFGDTILETNQWIHVIIPVTAINTGYDMNGDLTRIVGMKFEAMDGEGGEVYHIYNLAITKKIQLHPDTNKTKIKPDKTAKYISDAEQITNEVGYWNSSGVSITRKYRTEGDSSVMMNFKKQDDNKNSLRFLFASEADLSMSESVRFDLFIDDITLLRKNTVIVGFTSNKRFTGRRYIHTVDAEGLNLGWNSIEIPLKSFIAEEDADWSSIYGFYIGLTDSELDELDSFSIALDNLRIYKTFALKGETATDISDVTDKYIEDDYQNDNNMYIGYIENDYNNNVPPAEIENSVDSNGASTVKKIIRRKRLNSGRDYTLMTFLIVTAAGGALSIGGLTSTILVELKYRRALKGVNN